MAPDASTGPPGLWVERRSETNRLAKDFQARAYEELLPVRRRGPTTAAASVPTEVTETPCPHNSPKGVAA